MRSTRTTMVPEGMAKKCCRGRLRTGLIHSKLGTPAQEAAFRETHRRQNDIGQQRRGMSRAMSQPNLHDNVQAPMTGMSQPQTSRYENPGMNTARSRQQPAFMNANN